MHIDYNNMLTFLISFLQNLVEYILRQKIYDSLYWKQDCFGLSAERIVDKAVELKFVGGMFGEPQKPTEFICLILKMLQIQPDKEIILEFIKNDDFKYLRLLGAFYLRLVGKAVDVFNYLEPLLNDYRRVRVRDPAGSFSLNHIDELVDQMLRGDYLFNIALPRLPSRQSLEKIGQLEPRVSVLDDEFEAEVKIEEAAAAEAAAAVAAERGLGQDHDAEPMEEGEAMERRPKEKWQLGRDDKRRRDRSRSTSRDRYDDRDRDRDRGRRRHSRSHSRDRDRNRYRDSRHSRRDDSHDRYYRDRYDDRRRSSRSTSRDRDRDRGRDRRRGRDRSRDEEERRGGKRAKEESGAPADSERGGGKDALSVEETNKLRAQLGLPPLK